MILHMIRLASSVPAMLSAVAITAVLFLGERADAQVGTWNVEGKVKILACIGDQCVADSEEVAGVSILNGDGTYSAPNLGGGCLGDVPDEMGLWRLEGHNRIVFEATNVDDIIDATLACFPDVSFELKDYGNRGKLKKQGQLMKGKSRLRGFVTVQGQRVAARAVLRWKATPALAGTVGTSRTSAIGAPIAGGLPVILERLSSH
jgi:hypothetical protein